MHHIFYFINICKKRLIPLDFKLINSLKLNSISFWIPLGTLYDFPLTVCGCERNLGNVGNAFWINIAFSLF